MKPESVILLSQKYRPEREVTQYCKQISDFLSDREIRSHLICFGEEEKDEKVEDLFLHQVPFQLHGDNYFSWSMLVQTEFVRKVRELKEKENISLVHANNWQTIPASMIATEIFDLPLVITYHSIEEERGMDNPHSHHISELEWQGIKDASYIIVHKQETADALEVYDLPEGKIKLLDKNENWDQILLKIYENAYNVSKSQEELKEGGKTSENFNGYMGVSS